MPHYGARDFLQEAEDVLKRAGAASSGPPTELAVALRLVIDEVRRLRKSIAGIDKRSRETAISVGRGNKRF